MTDTTTTDTTTPADTTPTDAVTSPSRPYELVWLDPRSLRVDPANKRTNLGDLGPLTASIAALGLVQPIVVRPDGDEHKILAGQRRQAAAIAAAQVTVPTIVRADLAGLPVGTAVALVENEHRNPLTAAESARAYQQLRIDGLSATKIAKITGTKRAAVNQALTVGGSELAVTAADRYQLSMDQALVLAEFDQDHESVKVLVTTTKTNPESWDHVVARLRADRDAQAAFDAATARLAEAGIRVIDDDLAEGTVRLSWLVDRDGERLDPDAHTACPGHAVAISAWDPERTIAYCTDPTAHGHIPRSTPPGPAPTAHAAQRGDDSKAKAERRRVIEGNKAWRAARKVRRAFIGDLLARRSPPKTTLRYVTATITAHPERVGDGPEELVAELLVTAKADHNTGWGRHAGPAATADASDARLPLILLAQVAADAEQSLDDHAWRNTRPSGAARWLAWLASVGYQLSEIETQVTAAGTDPDPNPADRRPADRDPDHDDAADRDIAD